MLDEELDLNEGDEQDELFEHYNIVVDKGQEMVRIDKFLNDRLPKFSRNKIQEALKDGNVLIDGKAVKSNYKIRPNDTISIVMPFPKRNLEVVPEDIPLEIVYEDDDVVIINKQAGMVVHPGHGNYRGTVVNALMGRYTALPTSDAEAPRPGLVHRIDKNTSGLLIIARTEIALNSLSKQFFDHSIERKYNALVWGNLEADEGTITGHIGRSSRDRKVFECYPDGSVGKHAITHYKVLERFNYVTLVECKLETGRTHQIRVHFKHIGHPLFGDFEYGGDRILKGTTFAKYKQFVQNNLELLPRQALHAKVLGFVHPTTSEFMNFESELATDMQTVIERWRNYSAVDR